MYKRIINISTGRIILLYIFITYSFFICSQRRFIQIDTNNGLPQQTVQCITSDSIGYIWIGTYGGLCQFNGSDFKLFTSSGKTLKGNISHDNIIDLELDAQNILWIATPYGLNSLNLLNLEFKTYLNNPDDVFSISSNYIQDIFIDSEKDLWVGTIGGGLNLFNRQNDNFIHYIHQDDKNSLPCNFVYSIEEDKMGNIWIGTDNGLCRLNKKGQRFTAIKKQSNEAGSISGDFIKALLCDNLGNLWVGTQDGGLCMLPQNQINQQSNSFFFKNFKLGFPEKNSISSPHINTLIQHKNEIWAGTCENGIIKISLADFNFKLFKSNDKQCLIRNSNVLSLFKDNQDVVWAGTYDNGIQILNTKPSKFKNYTHSGQTKNTLSSGFILSVYEDENELILLGTKHGGINVLNRSTQLFSQITLDNNKQYTCNCLVPSKIFDGIWLGTEKNGLKHLSEKYIFDKPETTSRILDEVPSSSINAVYEDNLNKLWIGTKKNGLISYNLSTNTLKQYNQNNLDEKSLQSNTVLVIQGDSYDNIWIGTQGGGVAIYNNYEDTFESLSIPFEDDSEFQFYDVFCIFEDNEKNIWIGTGGYGLLKYNHHYKKLEHLSSEKSDLPGNVIFGIGQDKNNFLWLSTNKGLVKTTTALHSIKIYDEKDGAISKEYSINAAQKLTDGNLIFGSHKGFVIFNPEDMKVNEAPQKITINDIKINNLPVDGKSGYCIQRPYKSIDYSDTLILSPQASSITFQFAALNHFYPERIKYAYKLHGVDEGFIYTPSTNRTATYTNLSPGSYLFQVICSNNDGIWNKKGDSIVIIIQAQFWRKAWFWGLIAIALFFLGYFVMKLFRQIQARQKKQFKAIINQKVKELNQRNDEIERKNKKIINQKNELIQHKDFLKDIVSKRTAELERAKEKAEESDRLKTAFLTNMSHEIRTPMNAIVGFSTLLESSNLTDEDKSHAIQQINISCDSLLHLVDDIIDISKIESGEIELKYEFFELNQFLNELYQLHNDLKARIHKENIALELNKVKDVVYIYSDSFRLRQILSNLIDNAIKYTEKGKVTFGYVIQKNNIVFHVKDTGIGISKDKIPSIFERFIKIEDSQSKLYRGAGLGLSICKGLVKLMNGEIWVESTPGNGTNFFVELPFKEYEEDKAQKNLSKAMENQYDWSSKTILITEDEESNFNFIKAALHNTKAKILWAKNGQESVEIARNNPVDLILMDIKIPVFDGYEATRQIKRIKNVPVLAQTAFALLGEREQCLKAGCDDYISKPYTFNDLLSIIDKYI